ncbi:Endoplasmin [Sarcoptes scabiei]|uniref:Endoplasmin n=1 Tax=Sarcoptes scabiei TaxID=52283 RepID=A0A132ADH0_SARSC|nr:Endoplasmin [Sarcoptes scabiei]KPM09034.1 heat shock protein 90-like protein 3 [Sarcoptes scabiei]
MLPSNRYFNLFTFSILILFIASKTAYCDDVLEDELNLNVGTVDKDLGDHHDSSKTDDHVIAREEEAIKLDGLSVAQMKELREKAEKFEFQAEVNRMMKLIINSLYRNKEIFLRELISNASDALDKIRLLSLTDRDVMKATDELTIRIKADKDNNMLHITDTGIAMTKEEMIANLGTIAKSGTADFLKKLAETKDVREMNDLIGQFGVGFYSAFLVADKVIVTSKSNDDGVQHIWESDGSSFSIVDDPRGASLKRGTCVTLVLKEEAKDFLEHDTLRNLISKYSQFINFKIYLWASRTETSEEPIEDEITEEEKKSDDDDEAKVEDVKDDDKKPKTKKIEKTIWDWELINTSKPIWTRNPSDISDEEYNEFYKSLTRDSQDPLTKTHFVAEGEVTFRSLLYVPKVNPSESLNRYGTKTDNIKLYVRRVFITDDFTDMMPNYLNFIRGLVDSDDLPLNVSRETLQQHKLLKVIRKKLVRKVLDMLKKINETDYETFWKEYSTNIKLGIIEDTANRARLAKLLRFRTSNSMDKMIALTDYVKRMKEKQDHIYYMAGTSLDEVSKSPFVERLLKKGFEVLYLTDAVDEYAISSIPEFEGKKFQNVAKDGLDLASQSEKAKEKQQALDKEYEPLKKWFQELLKEKINKVVISQRLHESPCALVASQFGWTGNMERLALSNAHSKSQDSMREYYLSQKKTMELNPRHPLIKELLRRVEEDQEDTVAKNMAMLIYETATLRSGYQLGDTTSFSQRVETLLRKTLGIDENAQIDDDDDDHAADESTSDDRQEETKEESDEHDEL